MEADGMARQSKQEYLCTSYTRYRQAKRDEKTMMLDELTQVCEYHRRYVLWLLNRPLSDPTRPTASSDLGATTGKIRRA
jgi:hypothetical protein